MGQFLGNMGNTNVTDRNQANWGDLDTSEKGARVTSGVLRGLGQGMQQRQAPQAGRGGFSSGMAAPQSPVNFPIFDPRKFGGAGNGGSFYGDF